MLLCLLVAGLWLAAAGPAYLIAGLDGLVGSAAAATLCLVLSLLTYVAQRWVTRKNDQWLLGAALGGMLFRMAAALGAVAALYRAKGFGFASFVVWVIVFYLALLGADTYHVHLLTQQTRQD